jgi:hypothetical protein
MIVGTMASGEKGSRHSVGEGAPIITSVTDESAAEFWIGIQEQGLSS